MRFAGWRRILALALLLLAPALQAARAPSPFKLSATLATNAAATVVRFAFAIPPDHRLYADHLHFLNAQGDELIPAKIPTPVAAVDQVTGQKKHFYNQDFTAEIRLEDSLPAGLTVKFQGCSNSACYFPERHEFLVSTSGVAAVIKPDAESVSAPPKTVAAAEDWTEQRQGFKLQARQTGYLGPVEFMNFLRHAQSGLSGSDPLDRFNQAGMALTLLLILVGGLCLNFTPCVLPLIPINLAIIGAGKAAGSRREGFMHGAVYGAGMAMTYGMLGLMVVLTGAKFGTLNSSIWFNVVIALVFGFLALAMFGKVDLDFSRFEGNLGTKVRGLKSRSLVAFGFGGIAALLAGACVAPVVISVLLLSANLYAKGQVAGLLLPFLLGLGMALPWPFAGASLTFLPKPGKWMNQVKHGFGVLIVVFACYYAHLAWGLYDSQRSQTNLAAAPGSAAVVPDANLELASALRQARREHKPVFIDFRASWCKNCVAMEETVFNQSAVVKHLQDFIVVKYPAERPNESPAREVLDYFGAMGLPTFVVMAPPTETPSPAH